MTPTRIAFRPSIRVALVAACLSLLTACGTGADIEYEYPTKGPGGLPTYEKQESLVGPEGLDLFNFGGGANEQGGGGGVAVNAFLWRASLDSLSFMPLASADPFGGVIITEWYGPPESRDERFKVTVYILDKALRSDGIRANVYRQERAGNEWVDATVDPSLGKGLEDTILTRARQIRIEQAAAR